jgi:hypothetical protein
VNRISGLCGVNQVPAKQLNQIILLFGMLRRIDDKLCDVLKIGDVQKPSIGITEDLSGSEAVRSFPCSNGCAHTTAIIRRTASARNVLYFVVMIELARTHGSARQLVGLQEPNGSPVPSTMR